MPNSKIKGSCLCGKVRFEIEPPFLTFRYCHCQRCQKATGSAHASNIFIAEKQFNWISGEQSISRYDLPEAKIFAVCFCKNCGSRVPHKINGRDDFLIPAGALDSDPIQRPENNIFWDHRASWYIDTHDIEKFSEY